jgi:hypothetical protein
MIEKPFGRIARHQAEPSKAQRGAPKKADPYTQQKANQGFPRDCWFFGKKTKNKKER